MDVKRCEYPTTSALDPRVKKRWNCKVKAVDPCRTLKKKKASRCGSQFINNFPSSLLENSLQRCLFPLRVNGNNCGDPLTSRLHQVNIFMCPTSFPLHAKCDVKKKVFHFIHFFPTLKYVSKSGCKRLKLVSYSTLAKNSTTTPISVLLGESIHSTVVAVGCWHWFLSISFFILQSR